MVRVNILLFLVGAGRWVDLAKKKWIYQHIVSISTRPANNKTHRMCSGSKPPHPGTDDMASEIVAGEPAMPAKARFCVKCRIYIPIDYFMKDDATDSGSVCNRHELEKKLDTNGLRYCKVCNNYIALDLFPRTGAISYICKRHKYAAKSKETEKKNV